MVPVAKAIVKRAMLGCKYELNPQTTEEWFMALKVFVSPSRYVQGPDALLQLGEQLEVLGIKNPLILVSLSAKKAVSSVVAEGLTCRGIRHAFIDFGGESTWKEIEKIRNACIQGNHDAIINCGGGKTLDAGRCAAAGAATNVMKVPPEVFLQFGAGVPCINVPTVASTDAATSSASLVHTEKGTLEAIMVSPTNPLMVLVDTTVIARSPVRLLVAGMGDALATYFEADMCYRTSSPPTSTRALSTGTARTLARLCFDILMDYGVQARIEAEAGVPGPGLEAVAEANVLLSGLGFQSGGLSAAHAVGNAFEHVPEAFQQHQFHGEMVAFGTLMQLLLEARKPEFLDKIFGFCKAVGLPTTFEELSLKNVSDEILERVASFASKDIQMRSMAGASKVPNEEGRFYDHRAILTALKAADAYGRAFAGRP
jgi:glycerol dehydrogenase